MSPPPEPDSPPRSDPRTRALLAVLSVVVVDLVGFGIAIPVLPFLARDFDATGVQLGLILTAYAGAQFAFAPVWGRLSDRIGRRRVMLATIAGTSAALLWLGLADSLLTLFLARLLAGAFSANVSVAAAYITDVTDESERTTWMGRLGACFGVGFVLGPALGAAFSGWGHGAPMLVAAALAAGNLAYAWFALAEPAREPVAPDAAAPERVGRFAALAEPTVRRVCLLNLAFSIAVVQLETVFAFFMNDRFGYGVFEVAWIFVGMAVLMGGIQGGGMKALSARFAEGQMLRAGSLLLAVSIAWVPLAGSVAVLLIPLAFSAVGRAVLQPSMMSLVSLRARPEHRGVVLGTFQSFASLGRVVGPVAAGLLYDAKIAAPFWFASALLLVLCLAAVGLTDEPASDSQ
ncbi:MAG: MFS transporter [Myxococcales bacterium]|nr:MFS transporter [Myxococcales bacterium]